MTTDELATLHRALRARIEDYPAVVAAITVAAVTGLRIGEVLAMQRQHVDSESGRLFMPETKTGQRTHHLPAAALDILERLPHVHGNPWCFTLGRNAPIGYKLCRRVFADAAKAAGLSDVRLHDLRRTVMTEAASAGVGTHVLRDLLGHKTTAMADHYVRNVGNPVREAREQIGARMAAALALESGE